MDLALNKLPVTTWRWLGVNEYKLKDFHMPNVPKYNKAVIKQDDFAGVLVQETNIKKVNYDFIESYFNKEKYGVSEELVLLARNSNNTGVLIHAPQGERLLKPIQIEFYGDKENEVIIDNNLIIAEENSEITVVMEYLTEDETLVFHNGLTKIYAKDGAVVNVIKVQRMNKFSQHFDSNVAYVGHGAKVNYISIELGGEKTVTNYVTNLEETSSEANVKSIYLADKKSYVDISYIMNHFGRRSVSNIECRGALKDEAKKVFRGTIDFKKGASRAKGSEEEYAILLNKNVKSDAIPLLICGEDDVEGKHAASAGKIDENKLFYLMSRGFSEKEAKKIIVEASFRPIIDLIPVEELKVRIEAVMQERLVYE
ncbi:Fe-S cluster assembly protein SufD [Clostridium estertheticum]|uniref:Fe-S cluster assembly protein SufD n=1 Tax=Clostridium estertheticum TaxID=238834 RepID=UPI0013E93DE0|nr:Fe-S cluster assembly protein SufD [Clostridium estertheticum]MBZ9686222.1 Fe-S cluster assembly protein SufD [Clostridium estertheticum]